MNNSEQANLKKIQSFYYALISVRGHLLFIVLKSKSIAFYLFTYEQFICSLTNIYMVSNRSWQSLKLFTNDPLTDYLYINASDPYINIQFTGKKISFKHHKRINHLNQYVEWHCVHF